MTNDLNDHFLRGDFVFVIANILYFNILSLNYEGEVM